MTSFARLRAGALRVVTLSAFVSTASLAQATSPAAKLADSVRRAVEAGVEAADLAAVDAAGALAERGLAMHAADPMLLHYRAYALYRGSTLAMGRDGAAAARPYLDKARDILEPLVKKQTIPESYALLASVYGLQIAAARVQMIAGMTLGSKSSEWMERAVDAGPNNPRVWIMRGISAFNTPSAFGGGMDKAETYLKRAIVLLESDAPRAPLPAWGKADAHIWLGQVYLKDKRRDEARVEFQKAAALQPRNVWLTNVLIPALDKTR
jgi:tetratricopeptide (TPR) repeat protein